MVRRLPIGCALVLAGIYGCNSIAGINEPRDRDGGASSGSSGQPEIDGGVADAETPGGGVEAFVGRWTTAAPGFNRSLSGASCAQQLQGPQKPQLLTLVFEKGLAANTVVSTIESLEFCRLNSTVAGSEASLAAGQRCKFIFDDGEVDTWDYLTTTFTIDGSGRRATLALSASIFIEIPSVGTTTCLLTENGVYVKQ